MYINLFSSGENSILSILLISHVIQVQLSLILRFTVFELYMFELYIYHKYVCNHIIWLLLYEVPSYDIMSVFSLSVVIICSFENGRGGRLLSLFISHSLLVHLNFVGINELHTYYVLVRA